jgi:hypothetical protein
VTRDAAVVSFPGDGRGVSFLLGGDELIGGEVVQATVQ